MPGTIDRTTRRRIAPTLLIVAAVWTAHCISLPGKRSYIEEYLGERAVALEAVERSTLAEALLTAERRTEVDALLLLAMAEQESHFDLRARGRRGALGILQVRPATAQAFAARAGETWTGVDRLFDPAFNVVVGATYLSALREEFGSWDLALTAYNRGPTSARRRIGRSPSSGYAAGVLRRFEEHRARYGDGGR